jgi:hypothetical protein
MNPPKPQPSAAQAAATTSAKSGAATAPSTSNRKPWIKKTPVEVVLEQLNKQEERVAEMRKELAREERELAKLTQARKVLEAQ